MNRNSVSDITMGNQQGRFFWLAGLIDGEGNFCASYSQPSKKEQREGAYSLRICFQLGMTDEGTVRRVKEIFDETGIKYFCYFNRNKKNGNKPVSAIKVSSFDSLVALIELIEDKLFTKQRQAKLLKEYCLLRIPKRISRRNAAYTTSELKIIEEIRSMNAPRKQKKTLRDFMPRLRIIDDSEDDKVRTVAKSTEMTRN